MASEPTVFVVDDDAAVRDGLSLLLSSSGHACECFDSAQAFLERFRPEDPGCLVIDLQLPGLSGLELQDRLKACGCLLPMIFLTGHGNVPAAVRALKGGAVDFVQKPFDVDQMLGLVADALASDARERARRARREAVERRLASLTPREREVMQRVARGDANKVIALDLAISERTVELHRSRIMHKMEARSLPELVNALHSLEN